MQVISYPLGQNKYMPSYKPPGTYTTFSMLGSLDLSMATLGSSSLVWIEPILATLLAIESNVIAKIC